MTGKNLARYYDQILPQERLPLLVAALQRHDEIERERLLQSAPASQYRLRHHAPVVETYLAMSKYFFLTLLDTAAGYLEAFATVRAQSTSAEDTGKRWNNVLLLGYLFQMYRKGWHQFCADIQVDAEFVWLCLPGYATVQRVAQLSGGSAELPGAAFHEEGVACCLARQALDDPDAEVDEEIRDQFQPRTAADVAAELHQTWEARLEAWPGV